MKKMFCFDVDNTIYSHLNFGISETLPRIGSKKMFGGDTPFSSYEKLFDQSIYSLNFFGIESQLEMLKNIFPEINYFMFAFFYGADVKKGETWNCYGKCHRDS